MITVYCPKCFAENREVDQVCRVCGARLDEESGDYIERLINFSLHHPVPDVSAMAAEILGKIGDRRAVEPLIDALANSANLQLQEAAAKAIGRLGDLRAVPALSQALKNGPLVVRLKAAIALGEIGGEEASAALQEACANDPSHNVREEAQHARERLTKP